MVPKAIFFDFDGVFTDNRVVVSESGHESVICNRADGLGIRCLKTLPTKLFVVTTESNPVVERRCCKLELKVIVAGYDKVTVVRNLMLVHQWAPEDVWFVGNDLNDIDVMKYVGTSLAPSDADHSVKAFVSHVLNCRGGEGVAKEIARVFFPETLRSICKTL